MIILKNNNIDFIKLCAGLVGSVSQAAFMQDNFILPAQYLNHNIDFGCALVSILSCYLPMIRIQFHTLPTTCYIATVDKMAYGEISENFKG